MNEVVMLMKLHTFPFTPAYDYQDDTFIDLLLLPIGFYKELTVEMSIIYNRCKASDNEPY